MGAWGLSLVRWPRHDKLLFRGKGGNKSWIREEDEEKEKQGGVA